MNSIMYVILILWSMILLSCFGSFALEKPLLINCGLNRSTQSKNSYDDSVWQSDDDPAFAPPNMNTVLTTVTTDPNGQPPFEVARLISSPMTYSFSISAGPKFIRIYFSTIISYNNIPPYLFSTSLSANNFILFKNFNPFINSSSKTLQFEFQIIVPSGEKNLNLAFSPGENTTDNTMSPSYGYVNGIEIRSVPDGLYINESIQYRYVTDLDTGYTIKKESSAFQTVYRLNVGGDPVDPRDDSPDGGMMRSWEPDQNYLHVNFLTAKINPAVTDVNYLDVKYTKRTPDYVAPKIVYATARAMGAILPKVNTGRNITWNFEVDPGFDYLVRLHFMEMLPSVTRVQQRVFQVYIGGLVAEQGFDIFEESGGLDFPIYRDYIISVYGNNNGSKVPFSLALHPLLSYVTDVLLNGLEILKLSSNENLAVPNQPCNTCIPGQNQTTTNKSSSTHKTLQIIGGVIGGLLLVVVILLVLFSGRIKYRRLFSSAKSSSKGQWLPASTESKTTSATSNTNSSRPSLPSDLCRRFSLSQIQVATSNFDESSVIGIGGFGKVYKGRIDDGATSVAIKRLNPLSKQGAHEFFTEIEMLSRLRHIHLVSLIGYCDDQGEMILVYEYMPRGTLRDHLRYKDTNKDNEVDDEVLSWKQRLMICIGSARGLDYLHSGTKQLIIHRDVKTTNILLDDKWTAKVSDFGISKVGPASETGIGHVSTAVKGSIGYLDPEYYRRRQLTEKSDVYSLGVVLFEVLCARQVVSPNLPREQVSLVNWARSCYKKGTLHTIVDPNLTGQIAPECLKKFGEIADMCVKNDGEKRPSMRDVVWSLEFALTLQLTAEKNYSNDNPMVEILSHDGVANGDSDGDGSTNNDVFTNSIEENHSQNTGVGVDGSYSVSTTNNTNTTTDYHDDMKSGLVFSEILDPRAR